MNVNFTERVTDEIARARSIAARHGHCELDVVHLFVALLRQGDGVAAVVLDTLEVDQEATARSIESALEDGPAQTSPQELPLAEDLKRVLEIAMAQAQDLNCLYLGDEHLLLAIALHSESGEGAVSETFRNESLHHSDLLSVTIEVLGLDPRT